jgi:predicted exporter
MRIAWFALLIVVVVACAGLARLQPETEIAGLLSHVEDRDELVAILRAYGSQPPVFVHLLGEDGAVPDDLVAAADVVAGRLADDPRVEQLLAGVNVDEAAEAQRAVSGLRTLLVDAADPRWREPEAIDAAVVRARSIFANVATTEQRQAAQEDPYGWTVQGFELLSAGRGGPQVTLHGGRLLSLDLSSAFLLVLPTGEPRGTIHAVDAAKEAVALVTGPVEAVVTGAGAVAAAAEAGVREDMERSLAITGILLLALFVITFRNFWAPAWLAVPATAAAAAAGGLVGWFGWEIHGLGLAFASALLGLCVDFPLHLLVDATSEQRAGTDKPWRAAAANLTRPALACVVTSVLGFGLFLLSGAPLLNQLGMLGVPALILAALLGVGLLPVVGDALGWRAAGGASRELSGVQAHRGIAIGSALVCAALIAGAPFLVLDGDPQRLHAPVESVAKQNARFDQTFGLSTAPVMLAVQGESTSDAIEKLGRAASALRSLPASAPKAERVLALTDSLSPPSELTRRCESLRGVDLEAWRASLDASAAEQGLRPGAFDPMFADLAATPERLCPTPAGVDVTQADIAGTPMVKALFDRYLRDVDGVATASMFVFAANNTERVPTEWRDAVRPIDDGAAWLFFPELGQDSGSGMLREVLLLGGLGLLLALFLLRGLLGSFIAAMLALVPAAIGMLGTIGAFGWLSLLHEPLPAVGLGSCLLILGLGVDDGIYVVHALRTRPERLPAVRRAILLTTITSVVGFGALAVAASPALAAIGQVAVVGLILDLVAAVGIVPTLAAWTDKATRASS